MSTNKRLLRISFGKESGVGKDSACDYLISRYGGIKVSYSKPLYDIMYYAQDRIGIPRVKDRKFLQIVGTEWGRANDPDVWVNVAKREIEQHPSENIFISDHRFNNEKLDGFINILIKRNIELRNSTYGNGIVSQDGSRHSSETEIIDETSYDYIIENNTDNIQDFYNQLDEIVIEIYCLGEAY